MIMSKRYQVPLNEIRLEQTIANSRFIATLTPVFSVKEAKVFLQRIRDEFTDASHNVPAYLIGHGDSVIAHCSDAGEPSGTAGRPMLAVLQGSGLGDTAVVVTRYFGGTLLGTGGLVRAYGDAVRAVVEAVPRGEKVLTYTVMLEYPYNLVELIRRLAASQKGQVVAEDFAAQVTMTARFAVERFPLFQDALRELSNGRIEADVIEQGEMIVPAEDLQADQG